MTDELMPDQVIAKMQRKKLFSAFLCYSNLLLFIGNIFIFVATLLLKQPRFVALLMPPVFYLIYKTFKKELTEQKQLLDENNDAAMRDYLKGKEDANT